MNTGDPKEAVWEAHSGLGLEGDAVEKAIGTPFSIGVTPSFKASYIYI